MKEQKAITQEEAIKRLKESRFTIQPYNYMNQALDMAISALEKQEKFSKIKKRMKYERKIKFLCKHTYKIDSICGDGEVEVTCCKCGKKKFIRFSSKSLTEFRIGGKK